MSEPDVTQLSDETPLLSDADIAPAPAVIAAATPLRQEISDARDGIISAANQQITSIGEELANAHADILGAASAQATDVKQQIVDAGNKTLKTTGKAINATWNQLNNAYGDLFVAGVDTPAGPMAMVSDLEDTSGRAMSARFKPQLSIPCVDVIDGWYPTAIADGSKWLCPNGSSLTQAGTGGQLVCRYPDGSTAQPQLMCPPTTDDGIGGVGVDVPIVPILPISPPILPIGPPLSPPVLPIIPPSTGGGCGPVSGPAVMVGCTTITPPQPKSYYWLTYESGSDCGCRICTWQGIKPPTGFNGVLWQGQWEKQPPQSVYDEIAATCGTAATSGTGLPIGVRPVGGTGPITTITGGEPTPPTPPVVIKGCDPWAVSAATFDDFTWDETCVPIGEERRSLFWDPVDGCRDFYTDVLSHAREMVYGAGNLGSHTAPLMQSKWDTMAPVEVDTAGLANTVTPETKDPEGLLSGFARSVYSGVVTVAYEIIDSLPEPANNKKALAAISTKIGLANRVEHLTGMPLTYMMQQWQYLVQYATPQYIPSQPDLDSLYLTSHMSNEEWVCLTRANGNLPSWAKRVRDGKTVRPSVQEVVSLYRRGKLLTRQDMVRRLHENGVRNEQHAQDFLDLSEATPQVDDIIRFMVRDVFDQSVIDKYKLDTGFTSKYTDKSKEYGKAVGLSTDVAQLQWRAHWRVPSDTSLYSMLHRLRPNRQEVQDWDASPVAVDANGAKGALGKRPPELTIDEVTTALEVNDNMPFFLDKLTAIAYHPITNTDAQRMHQIGYINDTQLSDAIQSNGYNKANSDKMVGFYKAVKSRLVSNSSGVWTVRKVVKYLKSGLLTMAEADKQLTDIVADSFTRSKIIDGAMSEREAETKEVRMKELKRKFLYGQYSSNQLNLMWIQIGVNPIVIPDLLTQWEAERDGRMKEPRVTMVCDWFSKGLITRAQYDDRLKNMGYQDEDRAHIMQACAADNAAKMSKLAAKAAEDARKQIERNKKSMLDLLNEQIKELTIEYKQLQIQAERLKNDIAAKKLSGMH